MRGHTPRPRQRTARRTDPLDAEVEASSAPGVEGPTLAGDDRASEGVTARRAAATAELRDGADERIPAGHRRFGHATGALGTSLT